MCSERGYWGKRGTSERQDVRISYLESNITDVQKSKERLSPGDTRIEGNIFKSGYWRST